MELINLLIKPGKHKICLFCFNKCADFINIYVDKEIEEDFLKETLNVANMIKYLFPSFELTLTQICYTCNELVTKCYLIMRRNYKKKEILKNIINTLNKELNENEKLDLEDLKKGFLNVNRQCQNCFKIFNNIKKYKAHTKTHRRKRKLKYYYCNECNYKSQCKESVQGHKNKYHLQTRAYVCQTCFKSFYHKRNLVDHIQRHADTQNDICEICGEMFLYKNNLLEHLKLHSGERPYECDICGKKFITSGRRLEHIKRTHMEKTICCLFCDKKFSLNKELTRHMKNVHSSL
ncbi:zinc finger protein OZF-like [Melitaea cinxia]|uniref:zinc finger protein OZF-like n=1 Tax=Melitaea cinxia TaxID=113334 RepID=UPI001E274437|nr:zinc finger protein OZF-like [Melitaea cinxia]